MSGEIKPTIEEMQIIRALVRLSRRWPETLNVTIAGGRLYVVRDNFVRPALAVIDIPVERE